MVNEVNNEMKEKNKNMKSKITSAWLKDNIPGADMVGKNKAGNFVVRRGFFYTHGQSVEVLKAAVLSHISNAVIVASGEKNFPFRGGASVSKQSHWWVEFTISPSQS